jgi:hypothetical protein
MIVRARFRVPDGVTHGGKQLRVGDLWMHGEQVTTGGQIADAITMTLYALAIQGAPQQQRVPCGGRPCPDKAHPDFIHAIPFSSKCPNGGISPQLSSFLAATHIDLDPALKGFAEVGAAKPVKGYTRAQLFRL